MFLFENLEVYKKAVAFVVIVYDVLKSIPEREIKDQLKRAALSIPLNIAEGQGRIHAKEKRQFYNTARGSLYECLPLIQIILKIGYVDDNRYELLYSSANEVGKMLAGLIRSVGERERT